MTAPDPIEIIGAVLGVVNVALVVRRSLWNYPFGIAMVILYGFVFFHARLYSDAALQVYYLVMQIYGVFNWLNGRHDDGLIAVQILSARDRIVWMAAVAGGALVLGWFFSTYTNAAAPWLDAFIASASVVAQYLLSARKLENWILWIAVDVVGICVYCWRGLYPTTALYSLFLILAIIGLRSWMREAGNPA